MPRGKPLSAAHKAAISAGMKRYWATKSAGGGSGGSKRSGGSVSKATKTKIGKRPTSLNIDTGKQISREAAALIMFGSAGAAKKMAAGKKAKKRR